MLDRYPFSRWLRPVLVVLAGPVLIMAVLFPYFNKARENARRSSCLSSLKQDALGLAQYVQDADEKFPPIALAAPPKTPRKDALSGPVVGWADAIQPYLKSTCGYQCPSETTAPNASAFSEEGGYIDYWMNSHVGGRKIRDAQVILLGDGDGNGNAYYSMSGLPNNWQSVSGTKGWNGKNQPPWFKRHQGGANYVFTDGHVKWLLPEQVGANDARFVP